MNQLLDSPLEALAFNYFSFGIFAIVHNLWTWIAVITAAVSFWTIRAAGAAISSGSGKSNDQKQSTTLFTDRSQGEPRGIPEAAEKLTPSALVSTPASVTETNISQLVCREEVIKGRKFKLTVYYEDDGVSDVDDGEMMVTEWSDGIGDRKGGSCGEWWESWERLLTLRKGETGWYCYQDLTAINGNVVKLWDESRRRGR